MKVECTAGIVFGATGERFEAGETYDVPAKLANDYPDNFKKLSAPKSNKKVETEENK